MTNRIRNRDARAFVKNVSQSESAGSSNNKSIVDFTVCRTDRQDPLSCARSVESCRRRCRQRTFGGGGRLKPSRAGCCWQDATPKLRLGHSWASKPVTISTASEGNRIAPAASNMNGDTRYTSHKSALWRATCKRIAAIHSVGVNLESRTTPTSATRCLRRACSTSSSCAAGAT